MDQILFLFDLDQLLPLEGPIAEESKQDARLNLVKQTCLRILTYCSDAGKIDSKRRDLPSFGFRFYSSTEYFSLPNQLAGDFHELSKGSFDILESALTERFERVVQGALREVTHTPDFFTKHQNNTGRKCESETLRRSLEEIAALYNWDRPVLHSPVKKGQKTDQRIGNAVFIFTKLPNSELGLRQFLPAANRKKKLITFKDVSECVSSKRIKSVFSGQASISVHVVDTAHFHSSPLSEPVTAIFHKAFQDLKGSIIPVQAIAERCFTNPEAEGDALESTAQTQLGLPFSSALKTYLGEAQIPSKQFERNYSAGSLNLGDNKIGVGFPAEEGKMFFGEGGIEALKTVGLIKTSLFKPGQAWSGMVTIWGSAVNDSQELQSVLTYLQYARQCLLFEKQDGLAVLFYKDVLSGSLAFLNKIDSCFYRLLLKLNNSEHEKSPVHQQISTMMSSKKLPPLQFSPVKKPTTITENKVPPKFDSSTLEPYRLPDEPCKNFLDKLKKAERSKPQCDFMLKVRESYITGGVSSTGSNSKKKIEYDQEKRAIPKADPLLNKTSFEKKLSENSLGSHTSKSSGSRPLAMSRGAAMRGAAKQAPKIVVKSAEDSKTIVAKDRESVLAEKAQKIQSIMGRVNGDSGNTDDLIDQLVVIKDEYVEKGDALDLAILAEATVSILLKRLDTAGISKTNLEEVVGSKLLFDVSTISRRYAANPHDDARIAEHKVQVLFRSEVHWLLARKESLEAYENEILQHLRQISLYGSPQQLTTFLLDVMVECFIARQPELLCTLFDELDQERPPALTALFSPAASLTSVGPSSGKSSVASYISCSSQQQHQQLRNMRKPSLMRNKSFDANASHSRQINLGVAANKRALKREKSMISTTGRMVTKLKSGTKAKALANPLKQIGKSPKKVMKRPENVKRVLAFDSERRVASRKMVAAPCKKGSTTPRKKDKLRATPKKQTPRKMTPGKQHRMLAPETPTHKINRRKSDGQLFIPETPDHVLTKKCKTTPRRTQASLNVRRKSSFYNGAGSRNAMRAEESMNASLIQGNVGFNQSLFVNFNDSDRRDSLDTSGELNKSSILFPHLMNKKRKRESGDEEELVGNNSPVRTVKRRLQSFSEDDHLFGEIMMDNNAITNTPSKQIHRTPKKFGGMEDLFSPNKKVQFNMVPMHPTPTRGNLTPKGILKTPSKTPNKDGKTPNKTLNFGTPSKSSHNGPLPEASFLSSTTKLQLLIEDEAQKLSEIKPLNLTPIKKDGSPKKPPVKSSLISSALNSPSANTRQSVQSPLAVHCSSKTPTKSPLRRSNIVASDSRIFPIFRTPSKSPVPARKNSAVSDGEKFKTPTKLLSPKQNDDDPKSPIIKSSGKGKRFKSPMSSAWTSVSPRSEPKISVTKLLEMEGQDRTPTPPKAGKAALSDPKQCSRSLMQNIATENSFAQNKISAPMTSTTRDIGPSLDNLQNLIGESSTLSAVNEVSLPELSAVNEVSEVSLPEPSSSFPDLTSDIAGLADSLVEPDIPDMLPDTESSVIAEFSSPLRQNVDILQLVNSSPGSSIVNKFIDELKSPSKLTKPVTVKLINCSPKNKASPKVLEKSAEAEDVDERLSWSNVINQNVVSIRRARVSLSNISASSSESINEKDDDNKIDNETYVVEKSNNSSGTPNMDENSTNVDKDALNVDENVGNGEDAPNDDVDITLASFKKGAGEHQHSTCRDLGDALDAIQPNIVDQKKNLSVIQEVSLEESSSAEIISGESQNQDKEKEKSHIKQKVEEKPEMKQIKKNKVPKELAGLTDLLTEYFSPPTDGKRKSRGQATPKTTPMKESSKTKRDKANDIQTANNEKEDIKPPPEIKSSAAPITSKRRSKGYAWITDPSEKETGSENVEPLSRRRSSMNNPPQDVSTPVDLEIKVELSERRTSRRKPSITESHEDLNSLEPKRTSLSRRTSCTDFENKSLTKNKAKNSEWILEPNDEPKPARTASSKRNSVDKQMVFDVDDTNGFSWIGSPITCPVEAVEDKVSHDHIYYKTFALGGIKVDVGDYVLVNGDNVGGNLLDCEVAKVKYLFQDDNIKADPYRAVVEWFCRPSLLPTNIKIKHGYEEDGAPEYSSEFEVVKEARDYKNEISVQAIYLKCDLQEIDIFKDPEKIGRERSGGNVIPTYLLRFNMVRDKKCRRYYVEPFVKIKDVEEKEQEDMEVLFNGGDKRAKENRKQKLPKGNAHINETGDSISLAERRKKKILTERRASFNNIEEQKPVKGKSLTRRKSCFDTTSSPEAMKKYRGYAWTPVKESSAVEEVVEIDGGESDKFSPAERAKLRRASIESEKESDETSRKKLNRRNSSNVEGRKTIAEESSDDESPKLDVNTYSTPQLKKHKGYAWVPKTPQSSAKDLEKNVNDEEDKVSDIAEIVDSDEESTKVNVNTYSTPQLKKHKGYAWVPKTPQSSAKDLENKDNDEDDCVFISNTGHGALEDRMGNISKSIEVEHSEWQCCYCHKFFQSEVDLNPHMESCSSTYSKWPCPFCKKYFKFRDCLRPHKKVCKLKNAEIAESSPLEEIQSTEKLPKVLAALQDNLSGYFSPHDGVPRSRSQVERLVDEVQKEKSEPSKSRRMSEITKRSPSSQENTNPILQKRRKTSKETPQTVKSSVPARLARTASTDSDSDSRRRSVRSTPRPSYAELEDMDCELLDNSPEDQSPEIPPVTPIRGLAKNPKRFRLATGKQSGSDSPSVKEHFRETKRGSRRLSVKMTNDSPVMKDVSVALDSSMEVEKQMQEETDQVTPEKEQSGGSPNLPFGSPGKYFSMGDVVESPGGHIKMKLIRTPKPNSVRRPLLGSSRPHSSHTSSKSRTTPQMQMQDHMISRLNRSACKDIGISPNKLHALIAASPSPKKKISERDQVKEASGVNRTPRIRIKKIQSFDQENEGTSSWTSTVLSPKKCDPVASPLHGISRLEPESPVRKSYSDLTGESPARKVYSPLSSNSLYKLQCSPIIHTTIAEQPEEDNEQEPFKKKRRVNKQLYA